MERLRELKEAAKEGELTPDEQEGIRESDKLTAKFEAAMDDDFNTADGVAALFELVNFLILLRRKTAGRLTLPAWRKKSGSCARCWGLLRRESTKCWKRKWRS